MGKTGSGPDSAKGQRLRCRVLSPPPARERTAQSRAARAGPPTCCRACRQDRSGEVGPSRRWALTDQGYAVLGQVNVPVASRAWLQEVAEQHRRLQ